MIDEDSALWQVPTLSMSIWVTCTLITFFFPTHPAAAVAGMISLLALVAFGLVHAARRWGVSGSIVFFVVANVISILYEHLSIVTGFPFGTYHHNAAMGPQLLLVPVVIGPSYFGVCYLAWVLANILITGPAQPRDRYWTFAMPIVASFIVVGLDICADPLGATVERRWTYVQGGAFYGVPLSNYLGWYLVTWTIFQVVAVFLAISNGSPRPVARAYWYQATAFWTVMALQFPLLLTTLSQEILRDPSGWLWRSRDIAQVATLTSIYTMLAVAITCTLVVARGGNRAVVTGATNDPRTSQG